MRLEEQRLHFEAEKKIYESSVLTFHGVDGYDVYNTSVPFCWQNRQYLFGRVERRSEWARSWVRLFTCTGRDEWTLVEDAPWYQLEDPYIAMIHNRMVLGGTHVRYNHLEIQTYYGYFYQGTDVRDLYYFTTGPDYMKDIRLVELKNGTIGVFSRPRSEEILKKYKCESMIGFSVIDSLEDLSAEVIEQSPYIDDVFGEGEWGGCNQCYLLESGRIGVIGHKCYKDEPNGQSVYLNVAFVFDSDTRQMVEERIIGTRCCYPDGPAKKENLRDCAFTSGIVMREDGKVDLYSGIGDCQEGRIVIDNPFAKEGKILSSLSNHD